MQDKNIDYLRRLDHLIAETIALPLPERKFFLEQESNEDTGIRKDVLDMMENGVNLSESQAEIEQLIQSVSEATTLQGTHSFSAQNVQSDAHNLVGKTILHYEIIEVIGGGGMGVVYRGRDTTLDRFVALKFLSPRLIENQETRERFLNEARAASKLDHQNIGIIHEICTTEDGRSFIVMALYEGETLKDKINSRSVSPRIALDFAIQIAEGLRYSHKKGIVHRDIKPGNIIVTPENQLKIVDFGLALFVDRPLPNDAKKIMGTMGYMAPEQRQGGPTDFRTDIWSLGVILHEMLLGTRPEVARNSFIAGAQKTQGYTFPFKSLNTSKLGAILTRALQPDPNDRYDSVSDFLADLRKVSPHHGHKSLLFGKLDTRTVILIGLIGLLGMGWIFTSILPPSATNQNHFSIGIQLLELSPQETDEESYLTRGVTEEILSQMARYEAIKVISLLYLDELKSQPEDFAHNLGLTWVTNGAIHRKDDRIRISLQVSDAKTNEIVSIASEEGDLDDLQKLISDVVITIVHELRPNFLAEDQRPADGFGSIVPEAYNAYLQGKYHFQMETPDHLKMALEYYEEAIAIDDSFALAHASKVVPIYLLGDKYSHMPSHAAFYLARAEVETALDLNDELPEAYIAQGIVRQLIENDFEGARRSFERAIELNPNESEAYREYGLLLLRMGLIEDGLKQLFHSKTLSPTSLQISRDIARAYYYDREYDRALELLNEILALQPGFVRVYSVLSGTYLEMGLYDEAIAAYEESLKHDKPDSKVNQLGFLAEVYAARGDLQKANAIIEDMLEFRKSEPYQGAAMLCLAFARLGDEENTRYWFERALEEGDLPPAIRVDPRWDGVRNIIELPPDLHITGELALEEN